MTDIELLIRAELQQQPTIPPRVQPDWEDVLRRVQPTPSTATQRSRLPRRRMLAAVATTLVAVTVATVETPLGASIMQTLGDFTAWISGKPGEPAREQEQQAFEQENQRSWTAFPPDTELRRLIETKLGATTFTLFGFRSEDTLCLRLIAEGAALGASTSCVPVSALQAAREPALVVASDAPFGIASSPPPWSRTRERFTAPLASATFGIVSDGVTGILLGADDGRPQAQVAGNAFLYIADRPQAGERVRNATAIAGNGDRVRLPLVAAPFGLIAGSPAPLGRVPHGPVGVEREVRSGTIRWLEQHQPRGEPLTPAVSTFIGRSSNKLIFARELEPLSAGPARVVLAIVRMYHPFQRGGNIALCIYLLQQQGSGVGCGPFPAQFAQRPFSTGISLARGSDQYAYLVGAASDEVAAMKAFLANGVIQEIPLHENAYAIPIARALLPARVVAYDSDDRIIGNELVIGEGIHQRVAPAARRSMRVRLRLTGPTGTTAVLSIGKPAGGRRCHEFVLSTGGIIGGCTKWPLRVDPSARSGERPLDLIARLNAGDDTYLAGQVAREIARIRIRFGDGTARVAEPIGGFLAVALPEGHPRGRNEVITLTALDAQGKTIARRGMRIRN